MNQKSSPKTATILLPYLESDYHFSEMVDVLYLNKINAYLKADHIKPRINDPNASDIDPNAHQITRYLKRIAKTFSLKQEWLRDNLINNELPV